MNIREFTKPVTAKTLNESLAKRFGARIELDKFTTEQLQDARNKLRTKVFNVETTESFDSVQSEQYTKDKMFLDVINAEIVERPDDIIASIDEAITVSEGAEDSAELVMAAKDMVDRVTGWMEDTAEMQTESMLELADAIRDEHGQEKADQFSTSVKPSLEGMYEAMEACRGTLTAGVQILTGEGAGMDMMGVDPALDDPAMEPTTDADTAGGDLDLALDADDEFGAAKAAMGGEDEAGRAKRESKIIRKRAVLERSRKLGTILSKKK